MLSDATKNKLYKGTMTLFLAQFALLPILLAMTEQSASHAYAKPYLIFVGTLYFITFFSALASKGKDGFMHYIFLFALPPVIYIYLVILTAIFFTSA